VQRHLEVAERQQRSRLRARRRASANRSNAKYPRPATTKMPPGTTASALSVAPTAAAPEVTAALVGDRPISSMRSSSRASRRIAGLPCGAMTSS
jgi:hypothetical protein